VRQTKREQKRIVRFYVDCADEAKLARYLGLPVFKALKVSGYFELDTIERRWVWSLFRVMSWSQ